MNECVVKKTDQLGLVAGCHVCGVGGANHVVRARWQLDIGERKLQKPIGIVTRISTLSQHKADIDGHVNSIHCKGDSDIKISILIVI